MSFDPKIRRAPPGPTAVRAPSGEGPSTVEKKPAGTPTSKSSFTGAGSKPIELNPPQQALEIAGKVVTASAVAVAGAAAFRAALGVNDESIGVNDDSIGVNDDSIGVNDDSIGVNDDSIGVNDDSIGVNDDSIGLGLGPVRDPEVLRWAELADALKENPSYLRPDYRPDPAPVGAPDLRAAQAVLAQLSLSTTKRDRLLEAAATDGLVGARVARVVAETEGMETTTRSALFSILATDPKGPKGLIVEKMVSSPIWDRLTATEQRQVTEIFQAGGEKAMRYLAAISESRPEALSSRDAGGRTLLSNLAKLATQQLNPALYEAGLTRAQLLTDAMRDIVNPDRVDQGDSPTCTVTSMQYELVRDEPAEYARLMVGLTGTKGEADMVSGESLALQTGYLKPTAGDPRSSSEVIFQSAAMEFANGLDAFDEKREVNRRTDGREYRGLGPAQQTRLLQHLFGVAYETRPLATPEQRQRALDLLVPYDARGTNRPVILEIDMGRWNHAVNFERVENDRVHFRDPYGRALSMPKEKFLRVVVGVHLPASLAR